MKRRAIILIGTALFFSANLLLAQNGKVENKQADTEIRNNLLLIGQYYQSVEKDFALHINNYEKHLQNIMGMAPLLIDSQTGKLSEVNQ